MAFELKVTSDADKVTWTWEALRALGIAGRKHALGGPNYGDAIREIFLVFNCTPFTARQRQRIRLDHGERILYIDIMLGYAKMIRGGMTVRMGHILDTMRDEVPPAAIKYGGRDFDAVRFIADFQHWTESKRILLGGAELREPIDEGAGWEAEVEESIPLEVMTTSETREDRASGTVEVLGELGLVGRPKHFPRSAYGRSAHSILLTFHCVKNLRDAGPDRFRSTRMIAPLLVLDYQKMAASDMPERKRLILDATEEALSKAVVRRKLEGFDKERFAVEVREWIARLRER